MDTRMSGSFNTGRTRRAFQAAGMASARLSEPQGSGCESGISGNGKARPCSFGGLIDVVRRFVCIGFGLMAVAFAGQTMAQSDPNAAADCGAGNPLHGRTQAVVDAIMARVQGVTDCADVTNTHLASIDEGLNLGRNSLTRLRQWKMKSCWMSTSYRTQKSLWHYMPMFDAILSARCQWLGSALSVSTSIWRTV